MNMPEEWTEVNLVPPSEDDSLQVLLEVIDPLVHQALSEYIEIWFYSHYPAPDRFHLRLRILWQRPGQMVEGRKELSDFLDAKRAEGILVDLYEGSHGNRGQAYTGEPATYGPEMWEVTYRVWASQCELAITLLRHKFTDSLSEPLPYHWERSVHMLSNCLLFNYVDEVYLSTNQARGYLDVVTGSTGYPLVIDLQEIQRQIGLNLRQYLGESVAKKFGQDFNQP
jgi:hypothetical protein